MRICSRVDVVGKGTAPSFRCRKERLGACARARAKKKLAGAAKKHVLSFLPQRVVQTSSQHRVNL